MRYLSLVLALVVLTGCTTRMIDFTAISTKNVEIQGVRGARVKGEDIQKNFLIFSFGSTVPTIKGAVDKAIEFGGCDLLMDGVIYTRTAGFPLLYMEHGFLVEGTCVSTRKE